MRSLEDSLDACGDGDSSLLGTPRALQHPAAPAAPKAESCPAPLTAAGEGSEIGPAPRPRAGKGAPEPGGRVPESCCSHGVKTVLNFKSLLKNNKTQGTPQPPKILSPCPASLSNSSELLLQARCKPRLGNQPVKDRV